MPRSLLLSPALRAHAAPLRAVFDERFAEPRSTRGDRFVWDYWHVPGQYTALRTPAWTYFPKPVYERFHRALVAWGRDVLGCHDVSPPWLSCYVDGCGQQLHGDLPHGPWAFVFSLTPWTRRAFTGGETLIVRDEVLDYWSAFRSTRSIEEPDLVREVAPRMGQLTVFDPRLPHGVREVRGTRDPRQGRLVIHGWFVQPRPFVVGPVPPREVQARIDVLGDVIARAADGVPLAGILSLRISIGAAGAVTAVQVLTDTTRVAAPLEPGRRALLRTIRATVAAWRFAKRSGPSTITLPLVFEA